MSRQLSRLLSTIAIRWVDALGVDGGARFRQYLKRLYVALEEFLGSAGR